MKNDKYSDSKKYWTENSDDFSDRYRSKRSFGETIVYNFLNARFKKISKLIEKNITPQAKIIDIGCGSGIFLKQCARFNPNRMAAVDFSEKMLCEAKKNLLAECKNTKLDFIKANAEKLNLGLNIFDMALAIGLFDYLINPKAAIKEIERVIKPRGAAIITMPIKWSPLFFLRYWPGIYLRKHILNLPPILNSWSKNDAISFFAENGFKTISVVKIQHTMWIFELKKHNK